MRSFATFSLAITLAAAVGCGESPSSPEVSQNQAGAPAVTQGESTTAPGFQPQRPAKQYADPQQAVNDFLLAVKSGDDKAATALLSTAAQQEAWTNGLAISSEGFPDARFQISEVEFLQENQQAHVMTVWENQREYGQQKSFECVWLLRQESHGWTIYGMATKLEIEPPQPLVLNFENQPEMQRTAAVGTGANKQVRGTATTSPTSSSRCPASGYAWSGWQPAATTARR